ncbi:unnamed protein product [Coccothraustes coccothraustes]
MLGPVPRAAAAHAAQTSRAGTARVLRRWPRGAVRITGGAAQRSRAAAGAGPQPIFLAVLQEEPTFPG